MRESGLKRDRRVMRRGGGALAAIAIMAVAALALKSLMSAKD